MENSPGHMRKGRPPKPEGAMQQVAIRFPREMLDEIDKLVRGRLDRPDRAGIIRELIVKGLETVAHKAQGKP